MSQNTELKKKFFTIPNILTLLRILMIPLIVWQYCVEKSALNTAVLLLLSGLTDMADGYIARHYHMISDIGKALDPIADKLTQVCVLICLVTHFPMMLIPVVLMFIKEFISLLLSLAVFQKTGKIIGADWHGKITTCLLYGLMALHILWMKIPSVLSHICILLTSGMMLISFVLYTIRHLRNLKKADGTPV